MTSFVVVGKVSDRLGIAEFVETSWNGQVATERRSFTALPTVEYRSRQASAIPVRIGHGGRDVGRCIHLERSQGDIFGVALVDADDLLTTWPGTLFWSPELRHRGGHDIEISELAIVDDPASHGLTPLELIPGDARQAGDWMRCRGRRWLAGVLARADVAHRSRRFRGPVIIEDPTAEAEARACREARQSAGPVPLHRSDSGQRRIVNGQLLEIFHSSPYNGILSVR